MTVDLCSLTALADPTRREVFELLAERPRSVAELTRALPVSQSAVSQHLKVLREARLVRSQPQGARNIYEIDPAGLGPLRAWLERMWMTALDDFKRSAEAHRKERQ
jgi:DNA-binding transcriptional ArsR family regulator